MNIDFGVSERHTLRVATCCRGCIEKWYKFPKGRELTQTEQEYLVSVIMEWIKKQKP